MKNDNFILIEDNYIRNAVRFTANMNGDIIIIDLISIKW